MAVVERYVDRGEARDEPGLDVFDFRDQPDLALDRLCDEPFQAWRRHAGIARCDHGRSDRDLGLLALGEIGIKNRAQQHETEHHEDRQARLAEP